MICAHFGWTWEYLHHGIPFNTVQKIMRDLPEYGPDKKTETGAPKEETAEEFAKRMNNLIL